ncbi:MAG TPA: hypothetical protein VMU16_12135 [Candidatus Binataceae bacterium]|nr:hypothetical protein [Candidatus Binataceae bacterium]
MSGLKVVFDSFFAAFYTYVVVAFLLAMMLFPWKDQTVRRRLAPVIFALPLVWALFAPVGDMLWLRIFHHYHGMIASPSEYPYWALIYPPSLAMLLMPIIGCLAIRRLKGARSFMVIYWLVSMLFTVVVFRGFQCKC